jgi:lipopolysaccharide transport system permease protein
LKEATRPNWRLPELSELRLHSELVHHLIQREFSLMYRDTWMGATWAFVSPLLLLGIYSFVFTRVFSIRWPGFSNPETFAMHLFVGMIFHAWLSECLQRAPSLVVGEASLVKRVRFPVQVLPHVLVGVSLIQALVGFVIIVLIMLVVSDLWLTCLLLPFVILPFGLMLLGVVFFLGGLGVYIRDLKVVMGFVSTALLFLSPIFYPVSMLPDSLQSYVWLNPLTYPIETVRAILFKGVGPEPIAYLLYWIESLVVMFAGMAVFRRLRGGFNDVL